MPIPRVEERDFGPLYLAGERVPAGTYRQVETARVVRLDHDDHLPASLDGRVACYVRQGSSWGQLIGSADAA